MPCNSEYMEANSFELEISRVYCLLEEIKTGKPVNTASDNWAGYHPKVYNKGVSRKTADAVVAELCAKLTESKNINKYSLEMQTWWRDHQEADHMRITEEKRIAKEKKLAESAMQKITDKELAALKKWILK